MQMLELYIDAKATGTVKPIDVAADVPIATFMAALVKELHLPIADFMGRQLVYRLYDPGTGQTLPETSSLTQLGVPAGTTLALESYVAGAPNTPPVNGLVADGFHSDVTLDNLNPRPVEAEQRVLASPRRRSRRTFLTLGGAVLGIGSLGLGYAAYRYLGTTGFALLQPPATHVPVTAPTTAPQPTHTGLPKRAQAQLTFTQHQQSVRALVWSPDGTLLASGSNDAKLLIWNVQGQVQHTLTLNGQVHALAWSPDGQQLAVGAGTQVHFLNPQQGTEMAVPRQGHNNQVTSVAWSPQGVLRLVSTGADRRAVIWDGQAHQPLRVFMRHTSPIDAGGWAQDGATVATSSTGGVIRVWNAANLQEVHGYYQDAAIPMQTLGFASTGGQLAVGGDDGTVRLWNGLTCQQQAIVGGQPRCQDVPQRIKAHTQPVRTLAWSPDGRLLATGGNDGVIAVWQPQAGMKTPLLTVRQGGPVHVVRWSPDGQRLASAVGTAVTIWQLK